MSKTSRKSATIANLAYQYITIVLTIVNGIILVPLYLKYIDVGVYGAWLAIGNVTTWLFLVDGGLNDLLRQKIAKAYGSGQIEDTGYAAGTGLILSQIIGILPSFVGIAVASFLPVILRLPAEMHEVISVASLLMFVSVSLVIMAGGPAAVSQGLQRNVAYTIIYVTGSVFSIITKVVMLIKGYGVLAIPCGFVVRGLVWLIANWIYILWLTGKKLRIQLKVHRGSFLGYGHLMIWTFINKLARQVFFNCDAFIVTIIMGAEFTPVYTLTLRAWDILNLLITRIGVAFMPGLAHLYGEGKLDKLKLISRKLFHIIIWLSVIGISACWCFNKYFVSIWVGQEFYCGELFNSLAAIAIGLRIAHFIVNKVLFAADNIKLPMTVGTIQFVLRAAMMVLFVWLFGLLGGPLSMLIIFALGGYYYLRQIYNTLKYNFDNFKTDIVIFIKSVILALVILVLFKYYMIEAGWGLFILQLIGFCLISALLFFITDNEFRKQVVYLTKYSGSKILKLKK